MHRDLKPENFLFANKKENSLLKAIDFGLSVFFKPGAYHLNHLRTFWYSYCDIDELHISLKSPPLRHVKGNFSEVAVNVK